jgi:hypothetical protein
MDYYDTLRASNARSKQRRNENSSLLMSALTTPMSSTGDSGAGVVSPTSPTSPATGKGNKPSGGRSRWGNPDEKDWYSRNITTQRTGKFSYNVNKQAAGAFDSFLKALMSQGYDVKEVQSYNNRNIRGSSEKSQHGYGTAIDINVANNPMLNGKLKTDMPDNINALANSFGLTWGGSWKNRPDPMHFEYTG